MMSSATSQRSGRAPKDKNKVQNAPTKPPPDVSTSKITEPIIAKIQPTAEQLRIAQISYDASKCEDLKDKVERIIEITGLTSDAALVALHDCDNDSNRAAIMLLEGNQDEGKWETSGKKKKNRQQQQKGATPEVNGHEPAPTEKDEKEPTDFSANRPRREGGGGGRDGGGGGSGGNKRDRFQYRGPPRLNRGGVQGGGGGREREGGGNRNWHSKESEKNERNLQENRGGGESRRGGRSNEGRFGNNNNNNRREPRKPFPGRGRGRGGRIRTFQNRGFQNDDGFPDSIDTWHNSTAEKANTSDNTPIGNWSDVNVANEEWDDEIEDWNENLTETKVFTPSAGTQSSAVGSLDVPPATALSQNIDLASFLSKSSPNSENSNSGSGQPQSAQQSQLMSQQLQQPTQSQGHFDFSQFAKQAADQIKAAVGVVTAPSAPPMSASSFPPSSYQSYASRSSQMGASHDLQQVMSSPELPSHATASAQPAKASGTAAQGLPPRVKPPKARLPPPSKIPESAVVMPDDAAAPLDVQFGALQFGTDPSPFEFPAGEASSQYQDLTQSSNGSGQLSSQSMSMTSQSYSNALPSPAALGKEPASYSMPSPTMAAELAPQPQKVTSQDSMLLTKTEHKTVDNVSSYVNQRLSQSSNLESSILSSKPDQSSYNSSSFSTSTHDSPNSAYASYQTQSSSKPQQMSALSATGLVQQPPSGYADLQSAAQAQSSTQSKYGQSQAAYASGGSAASSFGLQQSAYSSTPVTTSASAYQSQSSYSSHGSQSYGGSSTGYSSQQNVYSGSVTMTTASSMIQTSSVSASSKLSNSLNHGVKDASLLESQHSASQHSYEVASTTSSASVLSASSLAQTSTNSLSSQNSVNNMNSVLGLVSTSSSTTTTSVLKNSLSASKTVQNIHQNVPVVGPQYIMGQASLPFYGLQGLQQPAVYSYEDVQVLQSKLSTLGIQSPMYSYEDMQMLPSKVLPTSGYYDMQFQNPTSMTARDPGMGNVAYSNDGKYSRTDTDVSTVATTLSQGQTSTQAHGQAFLNPAAALPPGYGYYLASGMMGGFHHYAPAPPIFNVSNVPPATNTHGATTNSQFAKANAYGSHSYSSGYESLSQTQDYSKGTYGAASQNQVKGVSGSGQVPDLSGSVYNKTHAAQLAKYNDKPGFHTGTPPPFNIAGNQGPNSAYAAQFIPVLAHQHNSMLQHHMGTDSGHGNPAAQQQRPQSLGQQKNQPSKQSYPYWASN